jgi:hypothetical protein
MREPYGDQNSSGCFFVVKLGVEFERGQSTHPPANGS